MSLGWRRYSAVVWQGKDQSSGSRWPLWNRTISRTLANVINSARLSYSIVVMHSTRQKHKKGKPLTRTEKASIFGLIILVGINAELGITDRASLDAFQQNLKDAPHEFLWPISLFLSAAGLGLLWIHVKNQIVKTALSYGAVIAFAFGMLDLTALITP